MTSQKSLWVALIAVAIIAVAGVLLPQTKAVLSGTVSPSDISATNFTEVTASNGMSIASGGMSITSGGLTLGTTNTVAGLNFGTCFIHAYAATIGASTTAQVDCQASQVIPPTGAGTALSGIVLGDTLPAVKLGSTTVGTLFGGLRLRAAEASTTAGFITLFVENDTGATYTWSTTQNATGTATYLTTR